MVKRNAQKKKQKTRRTRRAMVSRAPSGGTFGPVSTVSTAPVAIGNSLQGFKAQVVARNGDSIRVVGRDFGFTAAGTNTATGWCFVGGFPLTPACFMSSILRSYVQIYNKFKFNRCLVHYITSSSTATTGDILFSVNKNRDDPIPQWTASTFLNYALSDPYTIIGPQWTNHTCGIKPVGPMRTLDLGVNSDLNAQAQGELLMYSKTSSTDSPGYVVFDYDITFSEMSINPRAGLLPNPQLIYQPVQIIWSTTAYTSNSTFLGAVTSGTTWVGGTTITALTSNTNYRVGDIYKIALDITNTPSSSWTFSSGSATPSTVLRDQVGGTSSSGDVVVLKDGYTIYAVAINSTQLYLYPSVSRAFAAGTGSSYLTGATYTANAYADNNHSPNAGVWLYGLASLVGNESTIYNQQQ